MSVTTRILASALFLTSGAASQAGWENVVRYGRPAPVVPVAPTTYYYVPAPIAVAPAAPVVSYYQPALAPAPAPTTAFTPRLSVRSANDVGATSTDYLPTVVTRPLFRRAPVVTTPAPAVSYYYGY